MKNKNEMSKLKAILSKKVLSSSLASLEEGTDECILILHEPKQPETLKNVDLKQLRKKLG
ncbi:MAG: hypothetical protein K0R34_2499 [Herbinix sp.]|jgi:cyclic lactone autoinducer peptide|nr:hypothetical protein [Herbinix sp.]